MCHKTLAYTSTNSTVVYVTSLITTMPIMNHLLGTDLPTNKKNLRSSWNRHGKHSGLQCRRNDCKPQVNDWQHSVVGANLFFNLLVNTMWLTNKIVKEQIMINYTISHVKPNYPLLCFLDILFLFSWYSVISFKIVQATCQLKFLFCNCFSSASILQQ